jgi:hypothetical protein
MEKMKNRVIASSQIQAHPSRYSLQFSLHSIAAVLRKSGTDKFTEHSNPVIWPDPDRR